MKASYFLPIAAAMLIVIFYLWLPALQVCAMPMHEADRPGWQRHWFILALTAVYAVAAFVNLGDVRAPKTYRGFHGERAELRLAEPSPVSRVLLYTGIVQGTVSVELTTDGAAWSPAATLDQNHAALLKWQELELTDLPEGDILALRILGEDGAELGEAAAFAPDGRQLALLAADEAAAVLCDEQALVPDEPYFLNSSYFDEIYHARTAWEHLRGMYPYEVSHPPLGKLILSLGILLFGMNPFGWRFMGTLFGVLMLPVMYWFARRLFGGRAVPGCCAALLAADFMHFAQTRIATIDTYAVFFILLMYGFMLGWLQSGSKRDLALSGLFFGLGAASKWTCLYAGAGLGVLWALRWIERGLKASKPVPAGKKKKPAKPEIRDFYGELLRNVGFCLLFFVAVPALIYYLAYLPYGAARGCGLFSADYARLVWDNQCFMLRYHSGVSASHPYSSRWYQWVLDIRPILFYLKYFDDGRRSSFGAWLNPILCWAGLLALFVLVYTAIFRRDRKAVFLLLGYGAQLLPWVFITRTTYEYHYFPSSVFLVLALGYVFSLLRDNEKNWRLPVFGLCSLSAAVFALFYPAVSGLPVDNATATAWLKWLPTWPF